MEDNRGIKFLFLNFAERFADFLPLNTSMVAFANSLKKEEHTMNLTIKFFS